MNPGRLAAAKALLSVERGRHADRELARLAPEAPRDRALAWSLVMGVLRSRGALDARIDELSKRPAADLSPEVRCALRLGLFELHLSRVPPHAAVDQAVGLVGALRSPQARGLVNAVLRRSQGRPLDGAPAINHPRWLFERWSARFGREAAERWCATNDRPAPLAIWTPGDPEALAEALRGRGLAVAPGEAGGRAVPGSLWVEGVRGPVELLPGFAEGRFWVMDPSAAAVVELLQLRPGERVLDACAAPGGKSLKMAAAGAEVLACDLSEERLALVGENAARAGLAVSCRPVDWLQEDPLGEALFDAALADAPCTGLGTLRRHPEIRWSRLPTDPAAMALRQLPLLSAVSRHVRVGGRLVYSVCSPEPEEGREIVAAFLREHPDFVQEDVLDLSPPAGEEDAFYAARLKRER